MEARRSKGLRGSSASRIAAVGKENICPALSSREPLSASRSPLPEGFPRAPLQDITDILSPINILPNDDDGDVTELGLCRRGRKRSKCVAETQNPSCIARSEFELIVSSDFGRQNLANVTENTELNYEAKCTGTVEIEEESVVRREMRRTEHMPAEVVLKKEVVEAVRSLRTIPKRPTKPSSSSPATRASSRSAQEKPKMSSIMKFR